MKATPDQSKQLEGFLERALPEYEKMKRFFDQNNEKPARASTGEQGKKIILE